MSRVWNKIKDSISSMRYEDKRIWRICYWTIKVCLIAVPLALVALICVVVYAKIKGIAIPFFG